MRRLDAGHFAVEDHPDYISSKIHRFCVDSGHGTMIKRGVQLRAEAVKAPEKLEKFKNVSGIDPSLM